QTSHGALNDAVGGISAGSFGVFAVRDSKDQNCMDAGFFGGFSLAEKFVERELKNVGHRADGAADFFSVADKERKDELVGMQAGFGHEAPQGCGFAQAPRPAGWELTAEMHGPIVREGRWGV